MGERSAVGPKSGKSVSQSDPGLRRPTPPATAGRKPAARPPISVRSFTGCKSGLTLHEAEHAQPKTGRGAGQSPAAAIRREAPRVDPEGLRALRLADLSDSELAPLIEFFRLLDRWDREAHGD
jgi:hypothetical protein